MNNFEGTVNINSWRTIHFYQSEGPTLQLFQNNSFGTTSVASLWNALPIVVKCSARFCHLNYV